MIEREKLREGNYVVYSNEIMTVGEIFKVEKKEFDQSGIGVHLLHLNGSRYDLDLGRSPGDFDPLPINEEYLLATGFKKIRTDVFSLDGFTVVIDGANIHLLYGNRHVSECHGLHELQNQFHDFSGQELPLKLK